MSGCVDHCTGHEINDVSFVGTVHPEHGPGFDLWVGGGLSTNPMLAQRLGDEQRGHRQVDRGAVEVERVAGRHGDADDRLADADVLHLRDEARQGHLARRRQRRTRDPMMAHTTTKATDVKTISYWLDTATPSGDYRHTTLPKHVDVVVVGAVAQQRAGRGDDRDQRVAQHVPAQHVGFAGGQGVVVVAQDSSGLSYGNRVSPSALVRLLDLIADRRPEAKALLSGLARHIPDSGLVHTGFRCVKDVE
jgi:hypothetical protein